MPKVMVYSCSGSCGQNPPKTMHYPGLMGACAPFFQATDSKAMLFFKVIRPSWRFNGVFVQDVLIRSGPLPVTVTTRMLIFLVGDPNLNLYLPLLERG